MSDLIEKKPRHTNPSSTHTSVSINKREMVLVKEATEKHNRLYGTDITVKDFVREAIAQKIAQLEDELADKEAAL